MGDPRWFLNSVLAVFLSRSPPADTPPFPCRGAHPLRQPPFRPLRPTSTLPILPAESRCQLWTRFLIPFQKVAGRDAKFLTNPAVRDRVNCVNAMLCNQAGQRRIWIDPGCKHLITDLERVHWKADPSGNMLPDIDKSDPARSHVSDALGYMIAYEFGMRGKFGEMPDLVR
jgi:hypothetical protein